MLRRTPRPPGPPGVPVPADVRLVQFGMGMIEGTVVRWLKAVGDRVAEGEPLVEVDAEKVTAEMECPVAGTLVEILVQPGQTVPVREVLARVEEG